MSVTYAFSPSSATRHPYRATGLGTRPNYPDWPQALRLLRAAASGHAAAAPPRSVMRSRRLNWSNCIRSPPARAGLQDIELAAISQEVTKRFYNL